MITAPGLARLIGALVAGCPGAARRLGSFSLVVRVVALVRPVGWARLRSPARTASPSGRRRFSSPLEPCDPAKHDATPGGNCCHSRTRQGAALVAQLAQLRVVKRMAWPVRSCPQRSTSLSTTYATTG